MRFSLFILLNIFLLNIAYTASAQVGIGKSTINNQNIILDFNDESTNIKGIILSTIDILPTNPSNGTFLFDKTDKKVKVFENNIWKNLSDEGSNSSIINNTSEDIGQGVTIGNENTNYTGVLVLDAGNKSIVLPKINKPELNVPSPYPGMMCYDTASKTLAVYDGLNWNYWK